MFEEALALYKKLGDQSGQAFSINLLGHTVGLLGNLDRAPTLRAEAEALLAQPLQDRRAAGYLHVTLGMIAMLDRDYQQSVQNDKALALFREAGDLRSCAQCLTLMGISALSRGDAEGAARAYEQTLPLLRQLKDKIGIFYSMIGSAGVAVLRDRLARAARLFGAGEAVRTAIGHPAQPLERINLDYESYLDTTRAKMGETAFEAAFSEGQAMSYEQAIEYALSADEPDPPAAPVPKRSASALTRREREVALLVARGLTNRQVAGELTVSERTVTTHVDHILHKLGATSRSQVAAWIVEERLLPEEDRRTSDSR
jgi:non-specific serine/threonine protein kinase